MPSPISGEPCHENPRSYVCRGHTAFRRSGPGAAGKGITIDISRYQMIPFGIALVLQKSNSAYLCEFKFSPNSTVNEKAAAIANASCEQIR
jgi:hypothetical protein